MWGSNPSGKGASWVGGSTKLVADVQARTGNVTAAVSRLALVAGAREAEEAAEPDPSPAPLLRELSAQLMTET